MFDVFDCFFCGLGVCFCVQQSPIILSCLSWIRLGTNVGLVFGVFVWRRSRFGKDCFELYVCVVLDWGIRYPFKI